MKLSNLKSIYAGIANACGLAENVESENTATIVDKILAGTFALDDYLSYRLTLRKISKIYLNAVE